MEGYQRSAGRTQSTLQNEGLQSHGVSLLSPLKANLKDQQGESNGQALSSSAESDYQQ
jgi:hypothetical protein